MFQVLVPYMLLFLVFVEKEVAVPIIELAPVPGHKDVSMLSTSGFSLGLLIFVEISPVCWYRSGLDSDKNTHPSGTGTSSRFWTLHRPLFSSPSFSSSSWKTGSTTAMILWSLDTKQDERVPPSVTAFVQLPPPLLLRLASPPPSCQMTQTGCSLYFAKLAAL